MVRVIFSNEDVLAIKTQREEKIEKNQSNSLAVTNQQIPIALILIILKLIFFNFYHNS